MNPYNNRHQPSEHVFYSYATDASAAYFQRERFNHVSDVAERIILLIGGAISSLLIARFVLSLLAANTSSNLVGFVDGITSPLLTPFYGLFNVESVSAGSFVFEGYTLLAVIGYGLLTAAGAKLASVVRY